MFEKFEFISDDDEPKEYNVLVLGEAGVGKTAFINALHLFSFKSPTKWAEMNETSSADCAFKMRNGVKENTAIKKPSFSESVYIPTKREFTEIIPETDAGLIIFDSVAEHAINKKYNKEVANFMIRPHLDKESEFFLMEKKYMGQCNHLRKRDIGKIEITEMPPTIRRFPSDFHHQFDKIIIMGDYHDITTLRSIQLWAELVKAPARKIIVCVNKCDISPNDPANDLQSRKARILRHYFDNYNLEFASVKTGANLLFLYKYL
jgi:GTPase SAR1 family protein